MISIEIVVSGKVQGVWFRRFVLKQALKHKISGYVENSDNRDVFIKASGSETDMNHFIKQVSKGNLFSRVKNIQTFTTLEDKEIKGFFIR
ncbi:MAG: acylphosphatase [Candidatus Cloacimonadales bacterium]